MGYRIEDTTTQYNVKHNRGVV